MRKGLALAVITALTTTSTLFAMAGEPILGANSEQVAIAQERFSEWLKVNPYNKAAHRIDLKILCGHEFGEPGGWLGENRITTGGTGADILVPFPPFKAMHCLYGAQPGHPMVGCHFGRYPIVAATDLTVEGDYANEAKRLKERFEKQFGISMHQLPKGDGFEYRDEYNCLTITLDETSRQGANVVHYPLVVDIMDVELDRQSLYIGQIYEDLMHIERCKQLLANPQPVPNPKRNGNVQDEFDSVLPIKSFGVFTVGKLPDFDQDVLWVKKSINAEYLEIIDGVPFTISITRKGDAIASIYVAPLDNFKSKEEALPFYEKFTHLLDATGLKMKTGMRSGTRNAMTNHPNYYYWMLPTDRNVEMAVDMSETDDGRWKVSLFLKDLGRSSKNCIK